MANTIKDLLRDLAYEAMGAEFRELSKEAIGDIETKRELEDLVDQYHDRFIKEISKYFELEEK